MKLDLRALTPVQYAELRRRICRATGIVGTDLDELVHATFERLYRSGIRLRSDEHLFACGIRTARFVLSNERRRGLTVPIHDVEERLLGAVADHGDAVADRDACDGVIRALRDIGPRQRDAVWLHDVRDHSRREVAAALGITENAVDVALHRGRRALRRRLTPVGAFLAAIRLVRPRARTAAQPVLAVASVMVLVALPVGIGLDRHRDVPPATAIERAATVAGPVPRPAAAPAAPASSPSRVAVARPAPLPDPARPAGDMPDLGTATVCAPVTTALCAGAGGTVPERPGDTVYVVVPLSLVGRDDVKAHARQESVPVCDHVPETTHTGCESADKQGIVP